MQTGIYAGMLGSSLNVYAKERPNIPPAKRRVKEIEIPGRDGKVDKYDGGYEPTEITMKFNFKDKDEDKLNARWRKIQRWLSTKNSKLIFSDDPEVFYRIRRVDLGEMERTSARDILLEPSSHVAMYVGDGQLAEFSQNENGGITGGQTGDQTGREGYVHAYYDFPWVYVLRWPEGINKLTLVRWIPG